MSTKLKESCGKASRQVDNWPEWKKDIAGVKVNFRDYCQSADGQKWFKFPEIEPRDQQTCIVAAGPDKHAQILAVRWCKSDKEFYWYDPDLGLDPYPTEATTHWMPFPDDPE